MTHATRLPQPAPDVMFQQFDDGAVLFSTGQEVYFSLNTVGATVWELLASAGDLQSLCAAVATRHPGADTGTIERDVSRLLAELVDEGLLLPADGATGRSLRTPPDGTRRE